jgi:hypothetical protein
MVHLKIIEPYNEMSRVLAFDIGIKNLAWCCADVSPAVTTIRGWANENLVSGGTAEADAAADKCSSCGKKAGFFYEPTGKGYCVRHCPPLTPALRDLSGNVLKKIPAVSVLKAIAERLDADKPALKTKTSVLAFLKLHMCFPKVKVLVKKVDLVDIHEGIRTFILRNVELFSSCTEILLENQPAYKNPVMKSVQMMLFATLRDLCRSSSAASGQANPPPVRLVHAGRKTQGATGGDEGYAERKGASEARVLAAFRAGKVVSEGRNATDLEWFAAQKKRSDLADCLCMVMDTGTA